MLISGTGYLYGLSTCSLYTLQNLLRFTRHFQGVFCHDFQAQLIRMNWFLNIFLQNDVRVVEAVCYLNLARRKCWQNWLFCKIFCTTIWVFVNDTNFFFDSQQTDPEASQQVFLSTQWIAFKLESNGRFEKLCWNTNSNPLRVILGIISLPLSFSLSLLFSLCSEVSGRRLL